MLLYDYLEKEAKFSGPPTSGTPKPFTEHVLSEPQHLVAVQNLSQDAFRDDTMVDNLLAELKRYFGGTEIDSSQQAGLSYLFNPLRHGIATPPWDINEFESNVRLPIITNQYPS